MMKVLKRMTLLFLFSLLVSPSYAQKKDKIDERQIEVILGIDKIIQFDFTASPRVQVGNRTIIAYEIFPRKKEITFKGLKPGRTSITIRNPTGDVRAKYLLNVTANDQSDLIQKLKEFLGHIEGLEIGVKGDTVYLGGKLVVPSDMGLVNLVLKKFPDVMEMVELSPQSQVLVGKKMMEEIHKAGFKDVTIRVVNGSYWLEGVVSSVSDRKRVTAIAKAYLPANLASLAEREQAVQKAGQKSIIQNFIVVNKKKKKTKVPKMIKITAQLIELSKDYSRIFGFQWKPLLANNGAAIQFGKTAADGLVTKSQGTIAGTISNLFPKLASAKNAGQARVVQSGVMIVVEGVGGKIAKKSITKVAVGSGEFTKSTDLTSGFELNISNGIKILPNEKVDLPLGLGVSSVTGENQNETNNISTRVIVKSKDSAVVGGLVVNKSTTSYDKNPPTGGDQGTGQPLFSFLRSKAFSKSKTQFVVFVTPEIVENASTGAREILRKFRKRGR